MKYPNRAAAPAHLRTKTELKQQRLKPVNLMVPAGLYWQGFNYVALYDPADTVQMRPRRDATPEQAAALAAGRALTGTAPCANCGKRIDKGLLDNGGRCDDCVLQAKREAWEHEQQAVRAYAACLLTREPLFLDTESTGLDDQDEVIEIAILDIHGAVLLDTLVKPAQPIPYAATVVHGITDQDVETAPSWLAIGEQIAGILSGRLVIAHNAEFDLRMLHQTCKRYGIAMPTFETECTMELLTELNNGRWPSLSDAVVLADVDMPPAVQHRSKGDAEVCRQIIQTLARYAKPLKASVEP